MTIVSVPHDSRNSTDLEMTIENPPAQGGDLKQKTILAFSRILVRKMILKLMGATIFFL
jgi:hypothetical protein